MCYLERRLHIYPKKQGIPIFPSSLLSWPAWGDFQNEPRLGTGDAWGPPLAKCSELWAPFVWEIYSNCLNNMDLFCES